MDLKERVRRTIAEQGLIGPEDTVLCGVSGGADSLCLFLLLHSLYKDSSVKLHVMHIHHHLRKSADDDALFVRRICSDLSVPFKQKDVDVTALVAEKGLSTEEAARILRYCAFKEELCAIEPDRSRRRLAVAHNLNDDAETVLHNLFRGSGLKGLGGIRPLQEHDDYTLIRPLLDVSRSEIEDYLNNAGISWCTDESNLSDDYARNRIRNNLLPLAASQINERAAQHIHSAAAQLISAEDFISSALDDAFKACTSDIPDGLRIDRAGFLELHPYLRRRLALKCMEYVSGYAKDISGIHVEVLCSLFTLPTGKMLDLPHRLHAVRRRDHVELIRK